MFYIDLTESINKIDIYQTKESDYSKHEWKFMNEGYDLKFFKEEKDAEKYLEKYKKAYSKLSTKSSGQVCMIYKRRYLVQTALGEKMQTVRSYNKGWKPGKIFQLFDQTYFLPVQLESITQLDENNFQYNFRNL